MDNEKYGIVSNILKYLFPFSLNFSSIIFLKIAEEKCKLLLVFGSRRMTVVHAPIKNEYSIKKITVYFSIIKKR